MLQRSAGRAVLSALRLQQRQQQAVAAAAAVAAGAAGGDWWGGRSSSSSSDTAMFMGAAAAASSSSGGALLQQARSKWWWSSPPPPSDTTSGSSSSSSSSPAATATALDDQALTADASAAAEEAAAAAAPSAVPLDELPPSDVLDAASAVVEATGAAELAAFAAAKADVWTGTRAFIDVLDWAHGGLAMPWWAAIVASNAAVRLATLPVTVLTQKKSGRMTEMRAHTQHTQALYQAASKATTLAEYEHLQGQIAAAHARLRTDFGSDAKWALIMPLLTLANMAVFISQFSAVSTLAGEKPPSLASGGLAWFGDLTVPDPLWGLPVLCAVGTLAMVESGAMAAEMGGAGAATAQTLKWAMRGAAALFIPAGAYVPAAVGLLWASNSVMSLVQSSLLRAPRVRAALGLPDLAAARAAAAAAAAAGPSPFANLQGLLGKAAGSGGGNTTSSSSSSTSGAGLGSSSTGSNSSSSSSGNSGGSGTAATPPPPGMRPMRLVTNKPNIKKRR